MVAVDPDYQGRGIARQLMDRAHANAGGGISRPWAPAVTGHGPARASYEALGYTRLGVMPNYSRRPDGELAPGAFYYRTVDA